VIVAITIIWTSIKAFINHQTEKTKCFEAEASDKVGLNGYYTCYRDIYETPADGNIDELEFSIERGEIEIDALVVSILAEGNSKSFTITNTPRGIPNLRPYNGGAFGTPVQLPGKNSGLTYVVNISNAFGESINSIDWIKIAPVVEGNQCGASDEIYQIPDCVDFT
jgi:hypothetical protein